MRYRILAALLLLFASCAIPTTSSVAPSDDLALNGTARVVFTTPYGTGPRALALYQATVEPQNLGLELTDFVVTLTSASLGGSVSKTVPVAEASRVTLLNLPAASDWSFLVVGRKAGTKVAQFSVPAGQITTVAGEATVLGDVTLAPIMGTGSSPYRLDLTDLPARVSGQNVTVDILPLDGSGNPLNLDTSALKNALTMTWTETKLSLVSTAVATGTYRLTLHFKTKSGANDPLQPVFLLKLYPNLTSSATLSTSQWTGVSPATVAFSPPSAQVSGLVLRWQPSQSAGAAAYDWIWMPTYGKSPPAAPLVEAPELPAHHGTLVPTADFARANPAIIRTPADFNDDYATSVTWALFVRAISPMGEAGPWATTGNIDVRNQTFPIRINSLTLYGVAASGYGRILKTAHSSLGNGTFYAEPILAAQDFHFPGLPSGTTVAMNALVLNSDQFLTVQTPGGFTPLLYQIDRSHPPVTGPGENYALYQAELSGVPYLALYPAATFPQVAAGHWSLTNTPDATLSAAALQSVSGMTQNNFQLATIDYDLKNRPSVGLSYVSTLPADGDPHTVNWPAPTLESQVVHAVVRGSWSAGSLQVWGPWSTDKFTMGSGPVTITTYLNSSFLTWNQLPWSWGQGSAVEAYRIYRNAVWQADLPAQNSASVAAVDVAFWGQGDYSVTARIRRADGTTFETGPSTALYLAWASLPSVVLKDSSNKLPGDLNYDSGSVRGRGISVIADSQAPGWIITGTTGGGGNVFNARVGLRGNIDSNFGQLGNGMIYLPEFGQYFTDSVGAAQHPTTGKILMNDYWQNGVGWTWLEMVTKQGLPDATFASSGVLQRGPKVLPAGRPVYNAATNEYIILEYWEDYFYTRVSSLDASGNETHFNVMSSGVNPMAVQSNGNVILAGDGGWVRRFDGTLGLIAQSVLSVLGDTPNWTGVAVDPNDNGIVLVGTYGGTGYVVRLTSAGALDSGFDGDGAVLIPGFYPRDVAVSSSGDIFAVGDTQPTENSADTPYLVSMNSIGGSSSSQTLPGTGAYGGGARGVAVDNSGRVAVVGFAKNDGIADSSNTKPMFWEIDP